MQSRRSARSRLRVLLAGPMAVALVSCSHRLQVTASPASPGFVAAKRDVGVALFLDPHLTSCEIRARSAHAFSDSVEVEYHGQAVANWPGAEEFKPGVDAALADLAVKLDRTLAAAELPSVGNNSADPVRAK